MSHEWECYRCGREDTEEPEVLVGICGVCESAPGTALDDVTAARIAELEWAQENATAGTYSEDNSRLIDERIAELKGVLRHD